MRHAAGTLVLVMTLALAGPPIASAFEPVIGGPCEGCELVFVGMPEILSPKGRIAPPDEHGEPLRIDGMVTDQSGRPSPGIIVYAYHTDASGEYPQASTRHGKLRGWVLTDEAGRFQFDTIRPGAYPGLSIPQHVHMHIIEPGFATYWIADIVFSDDPLLTEDGGRDAAAGRGGSGLVEPARDEEGGWQVRRDVVLGLGIPGYGR